MALASPSGKDHIGKPNVSTLRLYCTIIPHHSLYRSYSMERDHSSVTFFIDGIIRSLRYAMTESTLGQMLLTIFWPCIELLVTLCWPRVYEILGQAPDSISDDLQPSNNQSVTDRANLSQLHYEQAVIHLIQWVRCLDGGPPISNEAIAEFLSSARSNPGQFQSQPASAQRSARNVDESIGGRRRSRRWSPIVHRPNPPNAYALHTRAGALRPRTTTILANNTSSRSHSGTAQGHRTFVRTSTQPSQPSPSTAPFVPDGYDLRHCCVNALRRCPRGRIWHHPSCRYTVAVMSGLLPAPRYVRRKSLDPGECGTQAERDHVCRILRVGSWRYAGDMDNYLDGVHSGSPHQPRPPDERRPIDSHQRYMVWLQTLLGPDPELELQDPGQSGDAAESSQARWTAF